MRFPSGNRFARLAPQKPPCRVRLTLRPLRSSPDDFRWTCSPGEVRGVLQAQFSCWIPRGPRFACLLPAQPVLAVAEWASSDRLRPDCLKVELVKARAPCPAGIEPSGETGRVFHNGLSYLHRTAMISIAGRVPACLHSPFTRCFSPVPMAPGTVAARASGEDAVSTVSRWIAPHGDHLRRPSGATGALVAANPGVGCRASAPRSSYPLLWLSARLREGGI